MNIDKIQKFSNSQDFFQCPICKETLVYEDKSLVCSNNHCFDISKHGYINFLLNNKQQKNYDLSSFENRRLILENGLYDHIAQKLIDILKDLSIDSILDAGCGEGYYSKKIIQNMNKQILAFDISKDSIQLAAKGPNTKIEWFMGDLAQLPLKNKSIDCILDIFSPANYKEFHRILNENGYLIKIIPNEYHLHELRKQAKNQLKNEKYSNEKVLNYFQEHFELVKEIDATKTYEVTPEQRSAFINMTPLLFNVDKKLVDWDSVNQITVGATILIGKA